MTKKITLPSMLAFERKLEPSDALMTAGDWNNKDKAWDGIKISVLPRTLRGTKSQFNLDKGGREDNNISEGDDAYLPNDLDTLKVSFSLRVIGDLGAPFGCNDPDFSRSIKERVLAYKPEGLKELAYRYAHNIAAGRFLWRNRVAAEQLYIQITVNDQDAIVFNGYDFSLKTFEKQRDNADLMKVANAIFEGLNSDEQFICLTVDAFVKLGKGQHVFPSQEMNMGEKKKVLFKLDNCAAMHSVKIGNAIRTIDDWYDNAELPIAIEPFGAVTQQGHAYRKTKTDLYTLMMKWVNDEEVSENDKNFVLANLIRGGVFGGKAE
ncbi:CRISPR-associated protein Csy3 family [Vibrio cincinnatiensis]|uniref:CRISPR-associated protein Csy3 n=1 Tax=Vibrio cincinnatiensis DSM 19608 TaxID=1123491 RepID=A0A1T4LBD2_VIBCI|nr:type I-F CRISPR-associated protein Csy3 [Vibrio cincinnatiensis]SJZ51931.1 CRISPR-associated protein Csy3 [Vibrio cincinnatiensis DSM 19608]SUP48120.1 CRISPR-associated protein Csy3 family [Vibrio cincinnatiensis]